MTLLERYIEQANPHEAGHILVGRNLGIPIYGLDHIVFCGQMLSSCSRLTHLLEAFLQCRLNPLFEG